MVEKGDANGEVNGDAKGEAKGDAKPAVDKGGALFACGWVFFGVSMAGPLEEVEVGVVTVAVGLSVTFWGTFGTGGSTTFGFATLGTERWVVSDAASLVIALACFN